jgi:hypothetical protein
MREGILVLKRQIRKPKAKHAKLPAALKRSESAMSMGSDGSSVSEGSSSSSSADVGGNVASDGGVFEHDEEDAGAGAGAGAGEKRGKADAIYFAC